MKKVTTKLRLTTSMYVYTTPALKKLAATKGKQFRSYSHYVSWLIAKDVGQKRAAKLLRAKDKTVLSERR